MFENNFAKKKTYLNKKKQKKKHNLTMTYDIDF